MKQSQSKNKDSYAFYTREGKDHTSKGFTTTFEMKSKDDIVDENMDKLKHEKESKEISLDDYMLKPNNLQYFYEEQETSEKVFTYHKRLHLLWRYTCFGMALVSSYFLFISLKQNHEIWESAFTVVRNAEERGYKTVLQADKSVQIFIDGKIVEVIPPDIQKLATVEYKLKT